MPPIPPALLARLASERRRRESEAELSLGPAEFNYPVTGQPGPQGPRTGPILGAPGPAPALAAGGLAQVISDGRTWTPEAFDVFQAAEQQAIQDAMREYGAGGQGLSSPPSALRASSIMDPNRLFPAGYGAAPTTTAAPTATDPALMGGQLGPGAYGGEGSTAPVGTDSAPAPTGFTPEQIAYFEQAKAKGFFGDPAATITPGGPPGTYVDPRNVPPPVATTPPGPAAATLPPDNEFFRMLADLESDAARAEKGKELGIINQDVLDTLLAQETMNINLGEWGAGDDAIFEWGVGPDGKPQIQKIPDVGAEEEAEEAEEPLVCDAGTHLEGGVCVPDTVTEDGPLVCDAGYHEEGGVCVIDAPTDNRCGDGYHYDENLQTCIKTEGALGGPFETPEQTTRVAIIEDGADERRRIISQMVNAGVINVDAAQAAYDTEVTNIFDDFLTEQRGVMDSFLGAFDPEGALVTPGRVQKADTAWDDLVAGLEADGVDTSLIAPELTMAKSVYTEGLSSMEDFLTTFGHIGEMSADDRSLLGELVFGEIKEGLKAAGAAKLADISLTAVDERTQSATDAAVAASLSPMYEGMDTSQMFNAMWGYPQAIPDLEARNVAETAQADAMAQITAKAGAAPAAETGPGQMSWSDMLSWTKYGDQLAQPTPLGTGDLIDQILNLGQSEWIPGTPAGSPGGPPSTMGTSGQWGPSQGLTGDMIGMLSGLSPDVRAGLGGLLSGQDTALGDMLYGPPEAGEVDPTVQSWPGLDDFGPMSALQAKNVYGAFGLGEEATAAQEPVDALIEWAVTGSPEAQEIFATVQEQVDMMYGAPTFGSASWREAINITLQTDPNYATMFTPVG